MGTGGFVPLIWSFSKKFAKFLGVFYSVARIFEIYIDSGEPLGMMC